LGLRSFAALSDGSEPVVAPKPLRRCLKNLKKLQRRLSRAKKRTPLYYKSLKSLQKAYYRMACKREGFLYQVAANLFRKFDFLAAEDLNILSMAKHPDVIQDKDTGQYLPNGASQSAHLNRAIYDASWRKFLDILTNKAEALGKWFCKVNPFRTTQMCSQCKTLVEKSLSTRTHCCPQCGYVADRDLNAAINILRLGLESLGSTLEAPTKALCV
jgi:putative transposase